MTSDVNVHLLNLLVWCTCRYELALEQERLAVLKIQEEEEHRHKR